MPCHEHKPCARCGKTFECKVGDVAHCHCNTITLTAEQRQFIEAKYHDCLCHTCLLELSNKYTLFKEKFLSPGQP